MTGPLTEKNCIIRTSCPFVHECDRSCGCLWRAAVEDPTGYYAELVIGLVEAGNFPANVHESYVGLVRSRIHATLDGVNAVIDGKSPTVEQDNPWLDKLSDSATRKRTPIYTGFVKYFPLAMAAVAQLSFSANEKHNPGEPVHWSKGKSADHLDCIARHLTEVEVYDAEADHDYHYLHAVKLAWRAMAHLETVLQSGVQPRFLKEDGR